MTPSHIAPTEAAGGRETAAAGLHQLTPSRPIDDIGEDHALPIGQLYPHLDGEQLKEAKENLGAYLELVLQIYTRMQADPEAYVRFKTLTASKVPPTMENTRSPSPRSSNTPTPM